MSELPVTQILPELLQALEYSPSAVLQAPPGAGKTTLVPLALLDVDWLAGQKIILLEPRHALRRSAWLICWVSRWGRLWAIVFGSTAKSVRPPALRS